MHAVEDGKVGERLVHHGDHARALLGELRLRGAAGEAERVAGRVEGRLIAGKKRFSPVRAVALGLRRLHELAGGDEGGDVGLGRVALHDVPGVDGDAVRGTVVHAGHVRHDAREHGRAGDRVRKDARVPVGRREARVAEVLGPAAKARQHDAHKQRRHACGEPPQALSGQRVHVAVRHRGRCADGEHVSRLDRLPLKEEHEMLGHADAHTRHRDERGQDRVPLPQEVEAHKRGVQELPLDEDRFRVDLLEREVVRELNGEHA